MSAIQRNTENDFCGSISIAHSFLKWPCYNPTLILVIHRPQMSGYNGVSLYLKKTAYIKYVNDQYKMHLFH